jgi:hypothetical protein
LAPSLRRQILEVPWRRIKGVVRGEFLDSLGSIDELRERRRCLEVRDTLRFHNILD